VLRRQKAANPAAFESDFRRFGVDVSEKGLLVAVDPSTGAELEGPAAAQKIIEDKRLIAVFQRAGRLSRSFRTAQVRVAKEQFYPASDKVTLKVGDKTLEGKVSDFVKTEAGMAVLMDRKVNTGKFDGLLDVLAYCAEACGAKSLSELAKFERDIATLMKYRKDYLSVDGLTQPGPALLAKRDYDEIASRRGKRDSRRPPAWR
jgi:hypothetical protein